MLDVGHELENLKHRLMAKGFSLDEAESICDSASDNVREAVIDMVADALEEAVIDGGDHNSHKFVQELMAIRDGNLFKITTLSGKTDFSEPPFPMLPKLLSNAKMAHDGSRYKKIPMRERSSESSMPKTIENAIKQINKQRLQLKADKQARLEKQRGGSSDPTESIDTIEALFVPQHEYTYDNSKSVATQFRTASDKQDPNSKWVRPAKKADMTEKLEQINNQLQDRIDDAIRYIMAQYGG
jgi:hypothetical protein